MGARRVADRARGNLAREKRAMLVEISERVENAADNLFKTIQGSHKQIADNYLSLKAYAVTAGGKLKEYVLKGKGKNLSSLGDLLTTVSGLSHVKVTKAEGVGAGGNTLPSIFTAKKIKVDASVSKINGLVNEYTNVCTAVRARWPMGLGKYLLLKLEESLLGKGVLGGQGVQPRWQLRVPQRSCCGSFQQAQRLRVPRRAHGSLRGYPRQAHCLSCGPQV